MALTVQIDQPGGPEAMKLVDLPVGEPGAGQIRIRHEAIGLNYIDVYQRTWLYPFPMPLTLGMEGAGVVEAVGEGVTHLKVGDRAAYASNPPGSYSEARVMPALAVCKLPEDIGFDTAAGMMQSSALVSAVTFAERLMPSIAASSPKKAPAFRSARITSLPAAVRISTRTSPVTMK